MTANAEHPDYPDLVLRRVIVLVRNYDEALDFYTAAFGARVIFDAPSPAGDRYVHIGFGDVAEGSGKGTSFAGAGMWLLHAEGEEDSLRVGHQTGAQPLAVFYTTDVEAATARVEAAGGKVVRPVVFSDGAHFSHVTDLYGNEFVIVELAEES